MSRKQFQLLLKPELLLTVSEVSIFFAISYVWGVELLVCNPKIVGSLPPAMCHCVPAQDTSSTLSIGVGQRCEIAFVSCGYNCSLLPPVCVKLNE